MTQEMTEQEKKELELAKRIQEKKANKKANKEGKATTTTQGKREEIPKISYALASFYHLYNGTPNTEERAIQEECILALLEVVNKNHLTLDVSKAGALKVYRVEGNSPEPYTMDTYKATMYRTLVIKDTQDTTPTTTPTTTTPATTQEPKDDPTQEVDTTITPIQG